MSYWTHIESDVVVPKNCRVGIKDLLKIHFEDYDACHGPRVEEIERKGEHSTRRFKFSISVCMDGVGAAKKVEEFVKEARELGMTEICCKTTLDIM